MDGQSDVGILYALEGLAWKIQANKARKKAQEKEAAAKAPSPESKKDGSEVLDVQGPQKSTKARQSGNTLSPKSKVQSPEKIQTINIQQPTSNIQHPENWNDIPNTNGESVSDEEEQTCPLDEQEAEMEGLDTVEGGVELSPAHKETEIADVAADESRESGDKPAGGTPALTGADKPQPSGKGSMNSDQADKAIEEWRALARSMGGLTLPNTWDAAELKAYLTNRDAEYFSIKTFRLEPIPPPAGDPRFNPASPWCAVWKKLQRHWKAQMNHNEKN
jgi:hypothetical protein